MTAYLRKVEKIGIYIKTYEKGVRENGTASDDRRHLYETKCSYEQG